MRMAEARGTRRRQPPTEATKAKGDIVVKGPLAERFFAVKQFNEVFRSSRRCLGYVEFTRFRGHPMVGAGGASMMPKSHHRSYAPEFRQRIIDLVRKGRTPEELACQFEPSAQAIRNWVK